METIRVHDEQAKRIDNRVIACEGGIMKILEAQTMQTSILTAQAATLKTQTDCHEKMLASQEKTQAHLESASANLEIATQAIADNSRWQSWAQTNLSTSGDATRAMQKEAQAYRLKENWRLIGIIAAIITVLLGLKAVGITI